MENLTSDINKAAWECMKEASRNSENGSWSIYAEDLPDMGVSEEDLPSVLDAIKDLYGDALLDDPADYSDLEFGEISLNLAGLFCETANPHEFYDPYSDGEYDDFVASWHATQDYIEGPYKPFLDAVQQDVPMYDMKTQKIVWTPETNDKTADSER